MDLNDCKDEALRIKTGKLFHRHRAATEKALSPVHFLNLETKREVP